jgi:hypothetical protein
MAHAAIDGAALAIWVALYLLVRHTSRQAKRDHELARQMIAESTEAEKRAYRHYKAAQALHSEIIDLTS